MPLKKQYSGSRRRRRRMDKFSLNEISAVDSPAQVPARASISKRDDAEKRGGDMADMVTSSEDGHQHGISIFDSGDGLGVLVHFASGGDEDDTNHDHQVIISPDGSVTMSENQGHSHDVDSDRYREIVMARLSKMQKGEQISQLIIGHKQAQRDSNEDGRNRRRRRRNRQEDKPEVTAKGRALSARLRRLVDQRTNDNTSRSDVVQGAARAAGISASTMNQILDGTIIEPPTNRLNALARFFSVAATGLISLAERDGETQSEPNFPSNRRTNSRKAVEMPFTLENLTEDQFDELVKRANDADELEKIAGLSAEHKAFYDKMAEADRDGFLAKSADERQAIITAQIDKAKDADPVIYKADNGAEYRKSDDPRLIEMAKQGDADRKELIKARSVSENARIQKFAETELKSFPGSVEVRSAIVKAVEGIEDEKMRDEAMAALKSRNAALAPGFKTYGVDNAPVVKSEGDDDIAKSEAEAELERLTQKRMEDENEGYYDAYDAVAKAHPKIAERAIAG